MYCFFLYIITSFYFLMLFLDAAYNSAETFSGSIFLFFLQPRPLLVFLRKCQRCSIRHAIPFRRRRSVILTCHIRPPNTDLWVIPCQSALVVRMPEVIDFVTELCLVRQDQEAMRKAFRNQELFFVFFRQFHTIPFSIGCGTFPQIHRHIKYASAHGTDKFALRIVDLEMQSAQYAFDGHGLVILYKLDIESGFFHFPLIVCLHVISAGVPVYGRCNHTQPFDATNIFFHCYLSHCFFLFHADLYLFSTPSDLLR